MAIKNCPSCNKQVPVACKKCGCGHTFFIYRRSNSLANESGENPGDSAGTLDDSGQTRRRRTTRVMREKPDFYDPLQYENQKKKRSSKSKSNDSSLTFEEQSLINVTTSTSELEPKKRRRGRPISTSTGAAKPKTNPRIQIASLSQSRTNRYVRSTANSNGLKEDIGKGGDDQDVEEMMADITPEKALQYNVVLGEINRKLISSRQPNF